MHKSYNVCLEINLTDSLKTYVPVEEAFKLEDAEKIISNMLGIVENQNKIFAIIPIYKKLKCDA